MRLLDVCLRAQRAELSDADLEAAELVAGWLEPLLGAFRVTLADLEALDPVELEAVAIACRRRELRLATWGGLAGQGEWGTASLAAELDGGEALGALRLRRGLMMMDAEEQEQAVEADHAAG